jgi:manganese/iron transport system permease protein/iron/zinc/copper transport system permease protein
LITKVFLGQGAQLPAMLLGAFIAGVATVAMVSFVTGFSRVKQDTAIGIMYTGIFAVGAFVVSLKYFSAMIDIDIYHYIVGSIVAVTDTELWLLAIVTSIVMSVVILFYRPLQLTTFDPIMAASIGIPVLLVEYLLTACASLVVVSGVQIVGVILVVALMITPAATAYLWNDRLDRMILWAAVIGVLGFWGGFSLATLVGASAGPSIVVVMTGVFLGSMVVAPRYGLLADFIRRRNTVPQEIMEDVLGAILRSKGQSVSIANVLKNVKDPNPRIRQAITMLARQDLLDVDGDRVSLTDDGRFQAKRLVRAHRLWEAYLEKTGTPPQDVHDKAHVLEHISDVATVDYLDDQLGHPVTDPHGTVIPPDPDRLAIGREVMASQLRQGYQVEVLQILADIDVPAASVGQRWWSGERSDGGESWTFIAQDGQEIKLGHQQADAVVVRIIQSPSTS